jgi:hypothetical protein
MKAPKATVIKGFIVSLGVIGIGGAVLYKVPKCSTDKELFLQVAQGWAAELAQLRADIDRAAYLYGEHATSDLQGELYSKQRLYEYDLTHPEQGTVPLEIEARRKEEKEAGCIPRWIFPEK